MVGFNPRVLAGGRDSNSTGFFNGYSVSIHASSREDATARKLISAVPFSFNPRVLAGGRDDHIHCHMYEGKVSIHASSREDATYPIRQALKKSQFQSTRPRGRTRQKTIPAIIRIFGFNPRVLAGGRDRYCYECMAKFEVSIHASSREDATI